MVQIADSSVAAASAKTGRRQREILAAASRVFREKGLHATGMRDIAAELGMHVGNLYYYFRNKQDLLAFCQQDALDGLLELALRVGAKDIPPQQKLRELVIGHVMRLNEETPGSLAHLEVEALEGQAKLAVRERRDRYEMVYRDLIREAIDSGHFVACDPAIAARAILGSVNWTVKWFDPGGPHDSRRIADEIAGLVVRGLVAPGGSPARPRTN